MVCRFVDVCTVVNDPVEQPSTLQVRGSRGGELDRLVAFGPLVRDRPGTKWRNLCATDYQKTWVMDGRKRVSVALSRRKTHNRKANVNASEVSEVCNQCESSASLATPTLPIASPAPCRACSPPPPRFG